MSIKAVDLFAGLGGNTLAAIKAGLNVVWAANHNPDAVKYHALNHPDVNHSCQDLQQANWADVPSYEFGMASPCCQGHTIARGKDGPHHYTSRSTAWAVVSSMEYHLPEFQLVENVPEFLKWKLYPQWSSCIEALGYSIAINILDSADHGIPQHRTRLFLIATKSKNPITLKFKRKQHVCANSIIDWDYNKWSDINKPGRAVNTLNRIRSGRSRYGKRFVMPYYGSGSGKTGRSIDRPIGTVTTKDRWAIVDDDRMRMFNVTEYKKAMSFPGNTRLPKQKHKAVYLLGNAVCPDQVEDVINAVLKAA